VTGEDVFLQLIAGLYDAAVNPELWTEELKRVCDALYCSGLIMFAANARTKDLLFARTVWIPDEQTVEYDAHYLAIDPRVRNALDNPTNDYLVDAMHISERDMDRSEYYTWLKRYEFRYYLATQWMLEADVPVFTSFQRSPKQGHVTDTEIALFKRLTPHIRRSVEIAHRLEEADLRQSATAEALNAASYGMVLLDEAGRVLFANRQAEAMAGAGDGLCLGPEGLTALRASDNVRLQQLIGNAIATGLGAGAGTGGAMAVPRPSGKQPYALTVAPLAGREALFSFLRPAAIVFLSDPETSPETPAAVLRRLYGLTPREAALAAALATGLSLDEAADRLAMAKETARRHIKSVFKKTGTRRQAELVRLLLTLPPVDGAIKG
jgi:DNA-binding CsgD family transcriptional regulator/PAS domain-containing protein